MHASQIISGGGNLFQENNWWTGKASVKFRIKP